MSRIIEINSISDVHEKNKLAPPKHPLITIIDLDNYEMKKEWSDVKFINGLYHISLKDSSCGLEYGRNTYDFDEGVMSFMAPGQVFSFSKDPVLPINVWMLYFHPDLIRNTDLGNKIDQYNFFSYDVYEALHLSEQEQKTITDCIKMIDQEINERIDRHSRDVIVSGIEFFLNFCNRFYERQFNTRSAGHKDVLSMVERTLKDYYDTANLKRDGLPTVAYLAQKANLSAGYLSDLLKNETGKTAKDHINFFLIERAKHILLASKASVSEIAYGLGFEYPQHFSKMFKTKTGLSPGEYRNLN